jgi:hypothetical protein
VNQDRDDAAEQTEPQERPLAERRPPLRSFESRRHRRAAFALACGGQRGARHRYHCGSRVGGRRCGDAAGVERLALRQRARDAEREEERETDTDDAGFSRELKIVVVRMVPDPRGYGRLLILSKRVQPRPEPAADERVIADDSSAGDAHRDAARQVDVGVLDRPGVLVDGARDHE